MKKFWMLLMLIPVAVSAQTVSRSWDGKGLSTSAHIRTLNIFINVIYDIHPDTNYVENSPYWVRVTDTLQEGVNVAGTLPTHLLDLVDTTYDADALHGSITRLYGESSFDSLQIVGDFIVVNVRESRVRSYGMFHYEYIVKASIELINNLGFSTVYGHNNLSEYCVGTAKDICFTNICIRNITKLYGDLNAGAGHSGNLCFTIVSNGERYNIRKGTLQCVGAGNFAVNPTSIVIHEISHALFGSNDFHTSGGNHRGGGCDMPFLNIQGGYGLMGAAHSGLVGCNGYERWRMHWKHPEAVDYIAARDTQNIRSLRADICQADGDQSFRLRDFVTYGDAVRIKLPYKDRETASNQYIWLENHQVGYNNKLDFLQYSNDSDCRPRGGAGIYAYYQVGRDVLEGSSSQVWPSIDRDNLKIIPAEGYWDYIRTQEEYNVGCVSYEPHNYALIRTTENPFCGGQDQAMQLFPESESDVITVQDEYMMWRKYIGESHTDSLAFLGDNRDAFTRYCKMGMATNPSTCNTPTYYANNPGQTIVESAYNALYGTQTTYLTGLSIEMKPQDNHDMLVRICWDDYDIVNNARWSGRIALKERAVLKSGDTITLVQNRTVAQATRNPETGLFAPRTLFVCEPGSTFTQEPNSTVILAERSYMQLDSGCTYTMGRDAELVIWEGCTLEVHAAARLQLEDARIVVDSGGVAEIQDTVRFKGNASIIVCPGGKLVVDDGVLTSACAGEMWQGIEVVGDRTRHQTAANQGVVELTNGAVIENARCAIRTGLGDDNWHTTGGINWYGVTPSQIERLQTIAERNTGRASVMAKGILCFVFGICYEEDYGTVGVGGTRAAKATPPNDNASELSIYPNPTDNQLYIELAGAAIRQVLVYDLQGRIVDCPVAVNEAGAVISTGNIPAGAYFVQVADTRGNIHHQRFIKK